LVAILAGSFLVFSATQRYLYPATSDAKARSVEARLASITDATGGGRLAGWERSWHVFREDPLLGIGTGNWRIATLKEENLTAHDFTYQNNAHNDFIEITTETGVFGGLFYVSIYILLWAFFIQLLIRKHEAEWVKLMFLPAFGILCYSFDAFFNFPQDRPEIQALFAIYIGMAVAFAFMYADEQEKQTRSNSDTKLSKAIRLGKLFTVT